MMNVHDSADMTVIDTDGCVVDPQASLLIEALSGCIHPRAARLTARLADLVGCDAGWEVICAGDVCYERTMASTVIDWLGALAQRGATVLIGDPGRSYLPKDRLEAVATYEVPVTRALEDAEIKRSSVWRLDGRASR